MSAELDRYQIEPIVPSGSGINHRQIYIRADDDTFSTYKVSGSELNSNTFTIPREVGIENQTIYCKDSNGNLREVSATVTHLLNA